MPGPRISIIDFYGRKAVPEAALRKALGVREGDALPKSKGDVEEALEQVPGVVNARLEAACCEDGKAILYVGIEEKGASHFDFKDAPQGESRLSQEIHDAYAEFLTAVGQAVRRGRTGESLVEGHSLMEDPEARKLQERFVTLARDNGRLLREVLLESGDEEHRAMAAYLIGYAPDKAAVVNDLQSAMRDPDDTVRNNAMRALAAIAILGGRRPELEIKVSPTWFIEMLDSLLWPDREAAAVALVTLTESRPRTVLDHLKERGMPALREMARWKHLPHALPAFILIGRVHGVAEEEIQKAWGSAERLKFLEGK